jgi:mannan endo-1,4-beta-mannosidase
VHDGGDLVFEVLPGKVLRPISPYVYGINAQPDAELGVTVKRSGGNRQTGYNWEIDASNAGRDYMHVSDRWACQVLGFADCDRPAAQYVDFARANRATGIDSVVVIPLVDHVVADADGTVKVAETAPSPRWKRSIAKKPGPFAPLPDLHDDAVYQDECVHFLVHTLGKASAGGVKFYALDNEPALWPSTHPRIHPAKTRYDEIVARTEAMADAITSVDPSAVVIGGTMFGWSEYMSLSEAPDAKDHDARYGTYVDYFLAAMKGLEAKHRRRLVHALDVHWYPEALGSKRITSQDISPKTVAARVQAPRSLWDPSYTEKSWIAAQWGKPIRLIPWLLERIDKRYPGTKLVINEYDYGAGDHISGGLAQVDVLGVFGREGLFMANYWGPGAGYEKLPPYVDAAFRLYRNYDGRHSQYGDTAVAARTADPSKASIFAAKNSQHPGRLTVIVINKEQHTSFNARIHTGGSGCTKAQVFAMDGSTPAIHPLPDMALVGDQIVAKLPPMSATLFVCDGR